MQDLIGKKIKLIKMVYEHPVAPGTTGKVTRIDNLGLIHVKWEVIKGKPHPIKGLCIDPDSDTYEVI